MIGEGQAEALGRSQKKNHLFLLLGSLKFAEMWDTSGLSPPNGDTRDSECPTLRDQEGLTKGPVVIFLKDHTAPDGKLLMTGTSLP